MADEGKKEQATNLDSKNLDLTSEERLKDVKRIIAVASGKGGVGKSTIAVNIAAALAADKHKVGILDADIYGPSIPMMLDITEMPKSDGKKIYPSEKYGMKAVSMGMFVTAGEALIWRGPMIMKAIQQFFDDVEWNELDYLVIDLPPGTGDAQLSMAQLVKVNGAVVVTTPQDVSFLDVTRAVGMFKRVEVPILGIVENMSYFKCPHCGEETEIFKKGSNYIKAGQLGYPLLAQLPIDMQLPVSTDVGKPIVLEDPPSEIATRLINLARKVHGQLNEMEESKS
ncbi:Mrp/NBP35 family ATP-binding protein [bacterium]|nr:Mrp/NBP35 family ATP-binding protein [bacterium]